ncbi:hypothetical protein AB4865_10350 [Capnocytophaga sp. ARDL2]|uniref:hypothetical protein n=1 Tax=Capnocytophaga sp. ARDL2 TaxID=3238809 RepID=UPI0035564920
MDFSKKIKLELIDKMKLLIEQCFEIMERDIDPDLSDDKLHNVLKAKRIATDDTKYYTSQIEVLEHEINGTVPDDREVNPTDLLKKFSKK